VQVSLADESGALGGSGGGDSVGITVGGVHGCREDKG
jgi:hypothetical protein